MLPTGWNSGVPCPLPMGFRSVTGGPASVGDFGGETPSALMARGGRSLPRGAF